ncbi:hypothetical protein ID866_10018 [Astraeus odoratus]|nr:hypothetical protein ID866_10018 [Astraeus odoratus]
MGVLAILSLVYKRQRETPKRPWKIWLFDVSKQIAGQMFVHGLNVLISDLGSHQFSGNACTYYFLNILVDTTLGVGLIYLILQATTYILSSRLHLRGFQSGKYGNPPSFIYWARQAAVYVVALTAMKLLVIALFAAWPGILELGDWLLSWTRIGEGESIQVIFVMGIFPILMNILQFWLIDSIVKASGNQFNNTFDTPRSSDARDREPLFRTSEEDDEDILRQDMENTPRPSSSRMSSDINTMVCAEDDKSKLTSALPSPVPYSASPSPVAHEYPPSSLRSSSPCSSSSGPRSRLGSRHSPLSSLDLEPSKVASTRDASSSHGVRKNANSQTISHRNGPSNTNGTEKHAQTCGVSSDGSDWRGQRSEPCTNPIREK